VRPQVQTKHGRLGITILASAVAIGAVAPLSAQWLRYRDPAVPRTADGRPNLSAPAPRTADGKPDLSGVWTHEVTSLEEWKRLIGPALDQAVKTSPPGMEIDRVHKYAVNILFDVKPEDSPMRPETAALVARRVSEPPPDACNTGQQLSVIGFPIAGLLAEPIKIVQASRMTLVLYEVGGVHRQIYSDGRTLPQEYDLPAYLGYSVGRWEGDTFVVETAGFNGKGGLDLFGHPRSDHMHITERFRRTDFGHLDLEMTFDDPKAYTKPFTVRIPHTLLADADIFEMFDENEKDCAHIRKP
jgi:hypothetical protein